ncbi:MAG TPA: hypothetical protein VHN80_12290 [Kineosporiaceae bacterium]|nr:hypothetical protein [Kineosporiaceae bacterium]
MSTSDEQSDTAQERIAADQQRLEQVGERVTEAKQAAAEVADRENISDSDRQAAVDAVAGEPTGKGSESTPG